MPQLKRLLLGAVLLLLAGCPPDPSAAVCTGDRDCPSATFCDLSRGLCRPRDARVSDSGLADVLVADASDLDRAASDLASSDLAVFEAGVAEDASVPDTAAPPDVTTGSDHAVADQVSADRSGEDSTTRPELVDLDPDAAAAVDSTVAGEGGSEDLAPCGLCPEERPVCSPLFGCVQCIEEGQCSGRSCNPTTHLCATPHDAG